jgi:hypothetical protein
MGRKKKVPRLACHGPSEAEGDCPHTLEEDYVYIGKTRRCAKCTTKYRAFFSCQWNKNKRASNTGALPPKFLWRHHVVLMQQRGEFELLVVWSRCIGRRRRRRSSGCKQARKKCDSAGVPMLGGLREPVTTANPTILLH